MPRDLRMPGGIYRVTHAPVDPTRDPVEMEWLLGPRSFSPPPHIHPGQVEEYEVLEGRLSVSVHGNWRWLGPGERAIVEPGAVHTFRNAPGERARVRNVHRPALGFPQFVERVDATLRGTAAWNPARLTRMASAWASVPETLVAVRPHERLVFALARVLGRHEPA